MLRRHRSPPFDQRVDARRPISTDLLAAASSAPLGLAGEFLVAWFDAVEELAAARTVLVFDEFVVGRPEPLLLEAAHQVRLTRRADHLGYFDDEEQQWYDEHPDSDDVYERPTTPERVLQQLADGQSAERLASGSEVGRRAISVVGAGREHLVDLIRLELTLERLVAELADSIRLGDAAFVDGRLPGERMSGLRWAA